MIVVDHYGISGGTPIIGVKFTQEPTEDETHPYFTIEIPESELRKRLQSFQALTGKQPDVSDVEDIIVAFVNELRSGKVSFPFFIDYSQLVGKDLEHDLDSPSVEG